MPCFKNKRRSRFRFIECVFKSCSITNLFAAFTIEFAITIHQIVLILRSTKNIVSYAKETTKAFNKCN